MLRLLVAVGVGVVVGVECVVASLSVLGTRSRPVTVAGRWSVVAVCSADTPCSLARPRLSAFRSSEVKAKSVSSKGFVWGTIFEKKKQVLSFLFFFFFFGTSRLLKKSSHRFIIVVIKKSNRKRKELIIIRHIQQQPREDDDDSDDAIEAEGNRRREHRAPALVVVKTSVPPLVVREHEQFCCIRKMRPGDYLPSEFRRGRNAVSSRMAVHVASDRTENKQSKTIFAVERYRESRWRW